MPALGVILSEFPHEPYLAENEDDGAVWWWRPHDLSWIRLVSITGRQTDRQTDRQTELLWL